ncbi:MAG: IclR family transcriptional regulator [Proteobacteria bacterium]|nr:IclR family transcriptional regulator [Pseudomonadota bacterium]
MQDESPSPIAENSPLFNHSTKKVFELMRAFGPSRRTMSLPELAESAGISKSAAQRLAFTLEDLGYLQKDPESKRYSLSTKILELGWRYMTSDPLIGYAEPYIAGLSASTKESVNLWRPSGTNMICVCRFPGSNQLVAPMPLGQLLPMYCSSGGRAYLAAIERKQAIEFLASSKLEKHLDTTETDPDRLVEIIDSAAADGFSTAFCQYYPTDLAFGAAITDAAGKGVAAINISVPNTRWKEKAALATFPDLIRETARAISANIRERLS